MRVGITKTANQKKNQYNPLFYYESARQALTMILKKFEAEPDKEIILPAYIGYSSREGSGIFDPIIEEKIKYSFYLLDRELKINAENLENVLKTKKGLVIVLIVHYYGIPDRNIEDIITICRKYNAIIIEDAAHALYTDFVDGRCGCYGDFTVYSLHKMLPFEKGGMLKVNTLKYATDFINSVVQNENPFDYCLKNIAQIRKENAKCWDMLLQKRPDLFRIIHPYDESITYQTFPIVILNDKRDTLYFELNKKGYGAVSLYHEMIEPIKNGKMLDAQWLSEHILNLPVHQDTTCEDIETMYFEMIKILAV